MEESRCRPARPTALRALKTHTRGSVPFWVYKCGVPSDDLEVYDESSPEKGSLGLLKDNVYPKFSESLNQ
jgi:2,3-bisphosphoglycerate-independent phosphoglycerate mutase